MSIILNNGIYTLLSTNATLTAVTGLKIFPVIAPADTAMPLILIKRSFSIDYTKDGAGQDNSTVEITVFAISYNQSIDIATKINNILSSYKGTVGGITVVDSRLTDGIEDYQDEAFIQNLTYQMKNY